MNKCAIVKDLFTSYISGVGSNETRSLVEEHIKTCAVCNGELTSMQNRVATTLRESDAKNVNVFKTMKKKIFRRNVAVAIGSTLATIALVIGVFKWVLLPQTPISYEPGLLNVQVNTAKYTYDENNNPMIITEPNSATMTFEEREVLDIVSPRKTANRAAASTNIEENGETIRLVFLNFTENLLSKWEPGGETAYAVRIVEPQNTTVSLNNGENAYIKEFDRVEVYYINQLISEINSQRDYVKLRQNGTLVWSGTLE